MTSSPFTDIVLLLATPCPDCQLVLGRFAESETAEMKISSSKSDTTVLGQKSVDSTLWVEGQLIPQVEESENLKI